MTIKMTKQELIKKFITVDIQPFYFLCKGCDKINRAYAIYTGDMLKCSECGSSEIELIEVVDE